MCVLTLCKLVGEQIIVLVFASYSCCIISSNVITWMIVKCFSKTTFLEVFAIQSFLWKPQYLSTFEFVLPLNTYNDLSDTPLLPHIGSVLPKFQIP